MSLMQLRLWPGNWKAGLSLAWQEERSNIILYYDYRQEAVNEKKNKIVEETFEDSIESQSYFGVWVYIGQENL